MVVDQVYCVNEYWLDYPRRDRVKINKCKLLTKDDKLKIRAGEIVSKIDRDGTQYFKPIR